jgi:hypothetical protein
MLIMMKMHPIVKNVEQRFLKKTKWTFTTYLLNNF